MPYIWTRIHDETYTSPPGYMKFVDDWNLNLTYDEVTNPNPPNSLIFFARISPKPNASISLKWGTEYYFDIGYLWLGWESWRDLSFREEIRLQEQYFYGSGFMKICPYITTEVPRRDVFPGIELNFNTGTCDSVQLIAYPPPVWVDP